MTKTRSVQAALFLLFALLPLSWRGLDATAYSGWPALGFAVAYLLALGRDLLRWALAGLTALATPAIAWGYDVSLPVAFVASFAVVLPAWLTYHLLTRHQGDQIRLDEVNSSHYHLVTALSALLCGLLATVAATFVLDLRGVLLAGLISFLAALTAQLAVLPLVIDGTGQRPAAGAAELWAQRILLVLVVLAVFWPTTRLSVAFMVFPMLGWSAVRASRRESHVQLFAVCVSAYVLTYHGRGPLSGKLLGVSEELIPILFYLFVGAACYLTVPLSLAVERMHVATAQATREATTVERLLTSSSGTIFIAADAHGLITHYNAGAQHTLGYAPAEVMGRSPAMFHRAEEIARHAAHLGVEPDYDAVVLEMIRRGERRDWELVRNDSTTRMASLTLSEVLDKEGKVVAYIGAGEDITERLRAQEALMTALDREHASVLRLEEVDHVKQELVSNVSHELRTPITSISGYAELLTDGSLGELNEKQVEAMVRIERNTERLGLLVEDLLTLSKAESGQLELAHDALDLRRVAGEAFDLLDDVLRVRELDVRLVLPDEPVRILGDALALERVVMNLMGNAIKFTPDGGSIVLTIEPAEDNALLSVVDTGLGIPEQDQDHLFNRFYRAGAATEHAIQGTGLGLSIVHSIVTQHGGSVSIDSSPGAGTTVRVVLPGRW